MDSLDSRDEEAPFVGGSSQNRIPKSHTRDVHILSSAFLLVFLAYGAAQNLESTVNSVSFFFISLELSKLGIRNCTFISANFDVFIFDSKFFPVNFG